MKSKFANNGTTSPQKRLVQKRYDLKKNYGLSIAEADYLRSTYCCEICGDKAKKMVIDHKIPGTYRGILCQQCNTRLGWVERYKEVIDNYLERGPQNAINEEQE
jgi:5-methylcytosine-specific restriction endonuclease McrA